MIDEHTRSSRFGSAYYSFDRSARVIYLHQILATSSKPSLIINDRELGVLRRSLGKDGWKRLLYLEPSPLYHGLYVGAGLLSVANDLLEIDVTNLELINQRLLCTCGNRVSLASDESVLCANCGRYFAGESSEHTLQTLQFNTLAAGAIALALVYGIEKDKAYAEKCVEILSLCAELYGNLSKKHREPYNVDRTADEARWLIALLQACDLIYYSRCISEDSRIDIENRLFAPVAEDLAERVLLGAEDAWRISALGVAGIFLKRPEMLDFALADARTWILTNLGNDGILSDSTLAEHFDALHALVHFNEACYRAGLDPYKMDPFYDKGLRRMFSAPLCCAYPSLRLPAVGSSVFDIFLPLDLYEIAFRRWDDPQYAWVLKRGYGFGDTPLNSDHAQNPYRFARNRICAFLYGRELFGRLTAYMPKSGLMHSLGLCCIKNGGSVMATVNYGTKQELDHQDLLGFTLYMNDQLLSPDYGAPADLVLPNERCSATSAHNAVVVDGESQRSSCPGAAVTHFFDTEFQGAEFSSHESYPGVVHMRRVVVAGDLCLLFDELTSDRERSYDWILRCEGDPDLPNEQDLCGKTQVYERLNVSGSISSKAPLSISWKCDKGAMRQMIWSGPSDAEYAWGICKDLKVPTLVCNQRGTKAYYISVFNAGTDTRISKDGNSLTAETGDVIDYFYSAGSTNSEAGPITTDASFVILRVRKGSILSLVMVRGSYCELNGEQVVKCPSQVECVEVTFSDRGQSMSYRGGEPGALYLKTGVRTVRINGHRSATVCKGGTARVHISPSMLEPKIAQSV